MYIGADYYPEHWDRKRWATDARLMKKAGFNVTRLAEFAWAMMEPAEGQFDFAWLDEALAVLKKSGVSVILCTPTAIVPAWAKQKYPDIITTNPDGSHAEWGIRKDQCYTSGTFRMLSDRVTRAMAEHFAKTPNVIGWQTDNEFGGAVCCCQSCRKEFQQYLRSRHETIEQFNARMGRHFWGHIITDWDQIEIPLNGGGHNPHLGLEWRRFQSWLNVRFQRAQTDILRDVCPKHFITHNLMGTGYPHINYFDLAEDLDFVSWDNYPIKSEPAMACGAGLAADLMRGCKGENFWVMETTSGPHGWGTYGRNPRPGEMGTWAFQQMAHGADGYVWFRWRACTAGREQYWHGILGHDGTPGRRYRETAAIAKDMHKVAKTVEGTTVKAKVAMLFDYDSRWAVELQPGYLGNDYVAALRRYYDALVRAGVNVDVIRPGTALKGYKLVLAPDLYVLPDALAEQIVAYVKGGGVFLADQRTGVKDETGLAHQRTLPGLLGEALGIEIEEYETLDALGRYPMIGRDEMEGAWTADMGADWITAKKAATLVGYDVPHMQPYAAVTRNACDKGVGWYVGTVAREESFYDTLIERVLADAKVSPVVRPPVGVEVSVREAPGKKLLFVINFLAEAKSVLVPAGKTDLLTGKKQGNTLHLPPFGVAVLKL